MGSYLSLVKIFLTSTYHLCKWESERVFRVTKVQRHELQTFERGKKVQRVQIAKLV